MPNENILRPPILGVQDGVDANKIAQPPFMVTPGLQTVIKNYIDRAMDTQGRDIINSMLNPESENINSVDVGIEDRFRTNIFELDRIPDVVRCLREFSGNPCEFSSWRKSVERILKIYETERGSPKYFGIMSVIRNKIIGCADQVLESYNTPLNWQAISKCLMLHYADKRDISTLEYQLTELIQADKSVEEFYQIVYEHLSLILNKISCSEFGDEATSLLIQTYRNRALDTFIRGLNGDLPRLLSMREPADLPQALQLCQKLENQNMRSLYASNYFYSNQGQPRLPPRRQQQNQQQQHYEQQIQRQQRQQYQGQHHQQPKPQSFYPQLVHIPQYARRNQQADQRFYSPIAPPRPPKYNFRNQVEPMDVDESMQTRRIDYMNRPSYSNYQGKRSATSMNKDQQPGRDKRQRVFHLNTMNDESSTSNCNNVRKLFNTNKENPLNCEDKYSDIHFLD